MKKYISFLMVTFVLTACTKVEETITETLTKTKNDVSERAQTMVKEKLNETLNSSINSLTNAEDAQFQEIFPTGDPIVISDFKGKKITFPNGSPAYVFRYTVAKEVLIPFLEKQETTNEDSSDRSARKIDGKSFIDKLTLIEKFLPANTIDMSFLEDLKNDKSIEYYKLKRFPNKSTIIYNPKSQQVYHFVEVSQ